VIDTATSTADVTARRSWRLDALLLALVAVVVRLPAFLAGRHLTFDDGQYGATALAMRHGDRPFIDTFSSQGPLHQPLIYIFDLVGLRTLDAPRLMTVAAGVVVTVATYAIARHLTSRTGAVVAAALVTVSGSVLYVTAPISGDGPAAALAVTAVALALRFQVRPSLPRAAVVGVTFGAALCVKVLVVPAAVPIALLLLSRRRAKDLATAVGAAVAVGVVAVLPWGIDRVWDQSVAYHQDSNRLHSPFGNLSSLVQTLGERDPFVVTAVTLAVAVALIGRLRAASSSAPPPVAGAINPRRGAVLLGGWLGAQVVLAAYDPAMFRPHVVHVIVPLALIATLRPLPWRVLAVGVVLLAPWWYSNVHDIALPGGYSRDEQAVVNRLRALPSDAVVISDDPGFAWRAQRRVPGNFVDVSMKRFTEHRLTTRVVARAAAAHEVCAVVVWSSDRLGSLPSLPQALVADGFHVAAHYGGFRVLYERDDCPG
jgi:4-amino-4-deoxy-L-arabinose transferase-like glycosyltransferase